MKRKFGQCLFFTMFSLNSPVFGDNISPQDAKYELYKEYIEHCVIPSDINEHLPTLRRIARDCSSVVELGVRSIVSSWALIQGLSESKSTECTYLGVDLGAPPQPAYDLLKEITELNGISFQFLIANDMDIAIDPVDLLFVDTLHTYAHLTYELEAFSPQVRKYIVMHDTSQTFEYHDCVSYTGDFSEYPPFISRSKRGLWPAVQDFLALHPEWRLIERHQNCNGLSVLQRIY